jgi:hypothetical protein
MFDAVVQSVHTVRPRTVLDKSYALMGLRSSSREQNLHGTNSHSSDVSNSQVCVSAECCPGPGYAISKTCLPDYPSGKYHSLYKTHRTSILSMIAKIFHRTCRTTPIHLTTLRGPDSVPTVGNDVRHGVVLRNYRSRSGERKSFRINLP